MYGKSLRLSMKESKAFETFEALEIEPLES